MDKRTMKIALACGLGGFIGTIVSLYSYLFAGIIAGGLTSYFSYQFEEVPNAVRQAWEFANQLHFKVPIKNGLAVVWRRTKETAKNVVVGALFGSSIFGSWLIPIITLGKPSNVTFSWSFIVVLVFLFSAAGSLALALAGIGLELGNQKELRRIFLKASLHANPFTAIFYWLPVGLWMILKQVPFAASWVGTFIKKFFLLIHSQERLLVLTDGAIGVIAGWFWGDAFIGALIGAAFGVLNWEIVSKRILKVVPTKS